MPERLPVVWKRVTDGAYWLGRARPDGRHEYVGGFTPAGETEAEREAAVRRVVDAINAAEAAQDEVAHRDACEAAYAHGLGGLPRPGGCGCADKDCAAETWELGRLQREDDRALRARAEASERREKEAVDILEAVYQDLGSQDAGDGDAVRPATYGRIVKFREALADTEGTGGG